MVGNNNSGSGYARDETQDIEVLRTELLTQETTLRALVENVDRRFQALKGHFDEIVDRLDALAICVNRNKNDDRRWPRDEVAQGPPVNRHVPAHHYRQPVYSDDSEENEDFLHADHGLQEVEVYVIMAMRGAMETSNLT